MTSSAPLLAVNNLQVSFRSRQQGLSPAVRGVSFVVNPGEVVAVVGESGSGKTVTAKTILRLLPEPPAEIVGGDIFGVGKCLSDDEQALRSPFAAMISRWCFRSR